ncbi:MAG: hypothetical protein B7Z15_19375 [Rhizobiales bacterium 32-66-8]|nr:MAG: hypothetical protein B7Z15_19375 [Rhizobiales bacterium 32-66-8]
MPWKIIASAFGWKAAHDDEEGPLVVWHPKLRRHCSGADAWRQAVLLSIRSPSAHPLFGREGRR